MSMDARLLCIADPNGRVACLLKAGDECLTYVGGTPGAERKVGAVLTDLVTRGVHIRVEALGRARVDVDFIRIGPDDPRFLDRCAAEFRTRGWLADVYAEEASRVWRKLYELPVAQDVRLSISGRLAQAPAAALADLERDLDSSAADFRRIAAA